MSRKVQVKVVELEGERRVVAIPGKDTTAADWRLAYREVRKSRGMALREEDRCYDPDLGRLSLAKWSPRREVQVKVLPLEGQQRVVAIPGEDTTTAEWRLAYREVRKLRDEVIREEGLCSGRRGARLSLAKLKARSGWSWNKTANVANTVYERHLRGNDVSRAAEWLKGLGKKDSLQKVKADLEDISQYGKLIDYPFNKDNIRYVIRHTRRWVKAG